MPPNSDLTPTTQKAPIMFPPVLDSNETEILRGGFGGTPAWVFTLFFGSIFVMTVLLAPLALWFWMRSSRFVLTDRRLVVKAPLRKPREYALSELQGAKVTIGDVSESIYLDGQVKVRLRWQRDFEKAWGAFLVMCQWPMPAASPLRGPGCEWYGHTARESDQVSQVGISVISGNQLAYIPLNSGMAKGGLGKRAALAAVGIRQVTTRAWFPHVALVKALEARGGDFAENVAALATALGGLVWSLPKTQRKLSKHGVFAMVFDERLEIYADEQTANVILNR
jgi:hypothetical protein